MITRSARVAHELGIDLRVAARIVALTARHPCRVWLAAGGVTVDGKSLLGITSLLARAGTEVSVSAEGTDEDVVVDGVVDLIARPLDAAGR